MPTIANKSNARIDREPSTEVQNRPKLIMWSTTFLAAIVLASAGLVATGNAQDAAAEPKTAPSLQEASLQNASLEEVLDQYNRATEKLRSSLKKVQASQIQFHNESSDHSESHRETWQQAIASGESDIESLRAAATELFRRQDEPSNDVLEIAVQSCLDDVREERYRVGLEVLKRANSIKPTVTSQALMARVQLLDNEFEAAKAFFDEYPDERESMTDNERQLYSSIDELISQFKREKQLRESESAKNDLPRVELTTTAGPIVLELFENEAPETVANFIHLVEQGYYNGVIFHNVKSEFVAQAGAFGVAQVGGVQRMMPRGVRYTIYDENEKPDARKHFRGSLSMANQNSPNTGSSQFFLSLTPQPFLNENHTVFGRVIEGLDVMADLTVNFEPGEKGQDEPIEGAIPSMILSAKVTRKRDHEYQPTKFGSKSKASATSTENEESRTD